MYLSEKKIQRLENKKRKLVALLKVIDLNHKEEQEKYTHSMENECESSSSDSDDSAKKLKGTEEPVSKKHKKIANTKSEDLSSAIIPKNLTMEEYTQLKLELHQRKIFLNRIPRIRIREDGLKAAIDIPAENRIPLFMKDVQHMLAYFLFGPYLKPYNSSPRWCLIEKFNRVGNVSLIVFDGLSYDDYVENEAQFQFLSQFSVKVAVINPLSYDGDIITDLSAVSIADNDKEALIRRFGNEENLLKRESKVFKLFKPAFSVESIPEDSSKEVSDKFPRTSLLLSLYQLVVENFPVPIKGELSNRYVNYRMSKDVYKGVSDQSPMFALDCEMCFTTASENELTRITIVNEKSEVVYESLVKPHNHIVNYLTRFSGITAKMLKNIDKRLEDVQDDLIKLLPADAILVGHSLNSDLHAMKMMHPYIIDTSVIFNLSGERWRKPKLQVLAWQFLGLQIQNNSKGHDSVEDSISALKLVQLKLSNDITFGDAIMTGKQHLTDRGVNPTNGESESKSTPKLATSIFNSLIKDNKSSIIISNDEKLEDYRKFVTSADENQICKFESISSKRGRVRRCCNAVNESKFSLVHIQVNENNKEKALSRLDKWCLRIWKATAESNACIVLFNGSSRTSSNGVCLVEIKRPPVPVRKPRLDT